MVGNTYPTVPWYSVVHCSTERQNRKNPMKHLAEKLDRVVRYGTSVTGVVKWTAWDSHNLKPELKSLASDRPNICFSKKCSKGMLPFFQEKYWCARGFMDLHPTCMWNFPYDSYCAYRDLPLNSLWSCNIKCRARKLSGQYSLCGLVLPSCNSIGKYTHHQNNRYRHLPPWRSEKRAWIRCSVIMPLFR